MNRGQFIAILIGVIGVIGVVVAINGRSEATTASANSSTSPPIDDASNADGGDASNADGGDNGDPSDTTTTTTPPDESASNGPMLEAAPENFGPAPDLVDIQGWFQTDATEFSDFDGQVKIVKFWTFGCFNCVNTLPHIRGIYDRHRDDGLEIIGVHSPEFDFERDPDAVFEAMQRLEVTWPVALDPDKLNFRSWQEGRRFWPRTFVVDANGDIRYDHIGEGAYDELEATVAWLLANGGS